MIVTVTCNPAIDKTIYARHTVYSIGGKGINVAKVLHNLHEDCLCTGFLGKENGDIITDGLDKLGISHDFIATEGRVRTNTKRIIADQLYEENEKGPFVSAFAAEKLLDRLKKRHDDIVIICGSTPPGIDDDFYYRLIDLLKQGNNTVILDADKQRLAQGIRAQPYAIKPNIEELKALYGDLDDTDAIIKACRRIPVYCKIISAGEKGALFMIGEQVYICPALKVSYSSALGAGDAMVAAAAYALANKLNDEEMIRLCMAAAAASVEQEGSEAPSQAQICAFSDKVEIKRYFYE